MILHDLQSQRKNRESMLHEKNIIRIKKKKKINPRPHNRSTYIEREKKTARTDNLLHSEQFQVHRT